MKKYVIALLFLSSSAGLFGMLPGKRVVSIEFKVNPFYWNGMFQTSNCIQVAYYEDGTSGTVWTSTNTATQYLGWNTDANPEIKQLNQSYDNFWNWCVGLN